MSHDLISGFIIIFGIVLAMLCVWRLPEPDNAESQNTQHFDDN